MNYYTYSRLFVGVVACACSALALGQAGSSDQGIFSTSARQQYPFILGIGGYFPTITGTSSSFNGGPELVAGVRYALDGFDIVGTARGKAFYSSNRNDSGGTFQVGVISVDVLLRSEGFYFGPGIGAASSTASIYIDNESSYDNFGYATWQTVWSLTAGFDIGQHAFVEARLQDSNIEAYKGYSLTLGCRF